jgi:alkylation response protein AidB-like acyl-CoA dehydrogenase
MTQPTSTLTAADHVPAPEAMRAELREWLRDDAKIEVAEGHESLEEAVKHASRLLASLYGAGWNRYGWPVEAGGLGGDARHRAVLYDELGRAGFDPPDQNVILEVVGPALLAFAPGLAAHHLPRILRGGEVWCQGFSEPDAGSDLSSLRCRATRESDDADAGFVINGQKVWTTLGHMADQMALLCRTGSASSRHRGLTMLFVDMHSPGVEARPLRFANGRNEVAEVFFHDVHVPFDRIVGEVDGGWAVAMYLLQFERGMYAWMRQAVLSNRLTKLAAQLRDAEMTGELAEQRLGSAALAVAALRARSSRTVETLAQGGDVGPAASVDKVLLATAEQAVFDTARDLLFPDFGLLGTEPTVGQWRAEWFYSRAASLYGGTAEIQRTIIADRVLNLPRE